MPSTALSPDQIALVRSSFEKVVPIAETAAELFYARLFEIAPEVRPLFPQDMSQQGRKLMTALALVVGGLAQLDTILPAVRALAVKHVQYGVRREHYAPVGAALVWTLEKGLGEALTPGTRQAWTAAYGLMSGAMIAAACDARRRLTVR